MDAEFCDGSFRNQHKSKNFGHQFFSSVKKQSNSSFSLLSHFRFIGFSLTFGSLLLLTVAFRLGILFFSPSSLFALMTGLSGLAPSQDCQFFLLSLLLFFYFKK